MNSVAPGSSIYSPTASANYGDTFAPFEIAKPGVPAKRLGTTMEVSKKTYLYENLKVSKVCSTAHLIENLRIQYRMTDATLTFSIPGSPVSVSDYGFKNLFSVKEQPARVLRILVARWQLSGREMG